MRDAMTAFPVRIKGIPFWTAVLTVFLTALYGCGLKRDPVPPGVVLPQAVLKPAAQLTELGISLTWTAPADAVDLTGFRIWRSEIEVAGADCPGCPRDYTLLTDLPPGARQLSREGGGKYRYNDYAVRPGRLYTYRIAACYGSGMCSEAADTADIKFN